MWQDWTSARSLESGQILKRRKVSTVSFVVSLLNTQHREQSSKPAPVENEFLSILLLHERQDDDDVEKNNI